MNETALKKLARLEAGGTTNIDKLKRRLSRLKKQRDELKNKHTGHEQEYTYHGGYSLGHIEGRISVIEDVIDDLSETYRQG